MNGMDVSRPTERNWVVSDDGEKVVSCLNIANKYLEIITEPGQYIMLSKQEVAALSIVLPEILDALKQNSA